MGDLIHSTVMGLRRRHHHHYHYRHHQQHYPQQHHSHSHVKVNPSKYTHLPPSNLPGHLSWPQVCIQHPRGSNSMVFSPLPLLWSPHCMYCKREGASNTT
ncbi:hypothetical protein E2C01_094836 [Portunus trituberculatus]|uniref:Uncharacterized protein n=1 Tax=Portunus trituberculatus TaxID=210409 RepID=A0A5B7JY98_PORTR|nr:hypothetical protein [Portunus trituberculatus]